ncbi:MAG: hypothetical protein JJ913_10415 [Rhizobiaceae bacterium]|nr:hypothetical protein [Rhizobiaceae bacterium]
MDWTLAIKRNREALSRILAALIALVGLPEHEPAGGQQTLPRHLHAQALRILRAAESAIRRLVVIAAREAQPRPAGARPDFAALRNRNEPAGANARIPAFPLLDPLKRYSFEPPRPASKFMPRICVVGITEPAPIPEKPVASPDDAVDATGLYRRLLSSRRALANLPREARRLARWYRRNRLKLIQSQGRGRASPLRMGRPPGGRKRSIHLVDDTLRECQALALDALDPPNTS